MMVEDQITRNLKESAWLSENRLPEKFARPVRKLCLWEMEVFHYNVPNRTTKTLPQSNPQNEWRSRFRSSISNAHTG